MESDPTPTSPATAEGIEDSNPPTAPVEARPLKVPIPQEDLHQRVLLLFLTLGGLIWGWQKGAREGWFTDDVPRVESPRFETDLNQAPGYELQLLPGVGPKTVQEIESHRERHGLFASPEDLDQVRGLGPAKLEQLREKVIVRPQ